MKVRDRVACRQLARVATMTSMAVVGTGAVSGFFASEAYRAGNDVTLCVHTPYRGSSWRPAARPRLLNASVLAECSTSLRFIPLATAPIQDGHWSAAELRWACDAGFAGVTIGASCGQRELDDPDLEVFWEAVAGLRMPVLIHRMFLPGEQRYHSHGITNSSGRPVDTTIVVTRLLPGGTLSRHPGLRVLLAHGGGALPYLWGRVLHNCHVDRGDMADPEAGLEALYFDTVVHDPRALELLSRFAGPGRVLLGSDHPFPIGDPQPLGIVEETVTDAGARAKVLGENARDLFSAP